MIRMKLLNRRKATPEPFSFSPSQIFEGNDGSWSTFIVRVGTPAQTFRVLISTAGQETWVPLATGCIDLDPVNCGTLRGVQPFENGPSNGFQPNESSTWEFINLYDLALENNLVNYTGGGYYGYDSVGLEIQNSGGPTLLHQIVAGIDTKDFMFGIFALGPKPTNFSDFNDPQPSYMWSLKNQSIIPSLSWAYTAGASYNNTLGSLVLGGYDAAIYDLGNQSPQDTQFNMDLSYNMPVGLQAIVATDTLSGVISLLPDGITSYIDSTVPEIWLPGPACDLFANAFGLQLDNATGRYLVNDTIHSQLLSQNPSITFKIGNTTYGGATTDIVFPYAAFDLQVNYPIYPNGTNYFPIRRADNGSQYVIGRTFLQEAYLVVDYERGNFSISQRPVQEPRSQQSIIQILPNIHNAPHSGLSTGAIVGITVAAVLFCLSLIGGAYFSYRQRKRRIAAASPEAEKTDIAEVVDQEGMRAEPASVVEAPNELVWGSALHEMDSGLVQEIGGREVKAELPGT